MWKDNTRCGAFTLRCIYADRLGWINLRMGFHDIIDLSLMGPKTSFLLIEFCTKYLSTQGDNQIQVLLVQMINYQNQRPLSSIVGRLLPNKFSIGCMGDTTTLSPASTSSASAPPTAHQPTPPNTQPRHPQCRPEHSPWHTRLQ